VDGKGLKAIQGAYRELYVSPAKSEADKSAEPEE